jgi:uncharacterized protein involved in exopolysaccharide biosynthesis
VDEFATDPSQAGQGTADVRRTLLLPLWRGRRLLLAGLVAGALGGLLLGVARPNTYRSVGKLMIRAGAREQVTPEMSVTGNQGGFGGGRNVVVDELHLLAAPEVFEEVARAVTAAEVLRPYDPGARDDNDTSALVGLFHRGQSWWFASAADGGDLPGHALDGCPRCVHAAALLLERYISVTPEIGSDVLTVSYSTHDPELARKVVAAFLEAAVAHHRKIYETDSTLEFLAGHMEQSRRELTTVEDDFTNYKTSCGVYDFESQQRTLLGEIHELEVQTARDQVHLEELRSRTKELGTQIAALPETVDETSAHNLQPNPDRAILKQRIFTLEDSLNTLERRVVGTTHEVDVERTGLTQALERTRKELEQLSEFVDAGPTLRRMPNPRREHLAQQFDDARTELAALESAATVRTGNLADLRQRLQTMAQCEPEFHSKEAAKIEARSRYEGFRSQHEKASLMGSMDERELSNLRSIQEATLPSEKEGPLRGRLLLFGIVLGLGAGCGLAFARHFLDHRLHDASEVEELLGLPVLATLPAGKARAARGWRLLRRPAV